MFKLFIDPGHGGSDPGAVANGLKEKDLTLDIGLKIRQIILDEYEGVEVKMSRTSDTYPTLGERCRMANAWGANFFLSIHINAGGGSGFESYRYPSASSATANYQKIIHQEIVRDLGWKDRGVRTANYYVLRETKMSAVLTENLFIDSADADQLRQKAIRDKCARAHVEGMAKAFGWKKKAVAPPPAPSQPSGDGWWIVQCGAFRDKAHAEQRVKELEQAGFSAFIYQK